MMSLCFNWHIKLSSQFCSYSRLIIICSPSSQYSKAKILPITPRFHNIKRFYRDNIIYYFYIAIIFMENIIGISKITYFYVLSFRAVLLGFIFTKSFSAMLWNWKTWLGVYIFQVCRENFFTLLVNRIYRWKIEFIDPFIQNLNLRFRISAKFSIATRFEFTEGGFSEYTLRLFEYFVTKTSEKGIKCSKSDTSMENICQFCIRLNYGEFTST